MGFVNAAVSILALAISAKAANLRSGDAWIHDAGKVDQNGSYGRSLETTETPELFARYEGEDYSFGSGVQKRTNKVGYIQDGDWMTYENVNFGPVGTTAGIRLRYAKRFDTPGRFEARIGGNEGTLIGILNLIKTSSWSTYRKDEFAIEVDGVKSLTFVATSDDKSQNVANIDWFELIPELTPGPTTETPEPFARYEGEDYSFGSGVKALTHIVAYITDGNWMTYENVNFGPVGTTAGIRLRYSKRFDTPARFEARIGHYEGTIIGELDLTGTSSWGAYREVEYEFAIEVDGVKSLTFVATSDNKSQGVANIDWFELIPEPTPEPSRSPSAAPTPAIKLHAHYEAEDYFAESGIQVTDIDESTQEIEEFSNSDWITYQNVNFGPVGATTIIRIRYSKHGSGGVLEARIGDHEGTIIGVFVPQETGGWQNFKEEEFDIDIEADGLQSLTFVAAKDDNENLINIDWFELEGEVKSCPAPAEKLSIKANNHRNLTFAMVDQEGMLCTLSKVSTVAGYEEVIPLARSYDYEEWGNAAGEVAAEVLVNEWICYNEENSRLCKNSLPALEEGEEYVLASYFRSFPPRDQFARLLSIATYGVTSKDLDSWDDTQPMGIGMANWVTSQMDTAVNPATSHRAKWRRHIINYQPISCTSSMPYDPCDSSSRWRTLAYSAQEMKYRPGGRSRHEFIDEATNSIWYLVKMDGRVRSVIRESDYDIDNPAVDFEGFEDLAPVTFNLPDLAVDGETDKLQKLSRFQYVLKNPPREFVDSGHCSDGTTVQRGGANPTIFGKLPSGEWFIYDPQLQLQDNSLSNPLLDGGGTKEILSQGVTLCANAPRTFLNSDTCRLSEDDNACENGLGSGGAGTLVCGSPGEGPNDLTVPMGLPFAGGTTTAHIFDMRVTRKTIWTTVSLTASDQLRQRMAFALSQIFAVANGAISESYKSERFVNYYDIFVRNAFGNYRDILTEIAFSPMMGENLSYAKSKSHAHVRETMNIITDADENMAREVMQLFTIGLALLNDDGTLKRDSNGDKMDTYTKEDMHNFARGWTGFDYQTNRGNIESQQSDDNNYIDPMKMVASWRDKFPKRNLDGGYIGDHSYPLCEDLPPRAFLSKGARFRFLGRSMFSDSIYTSPDYLDDETTAEFELDESSQLRSLLCSDAGDQCTSQPLTNEIVLSSTISCSTNECDVDTLRVIKVAEDRYWEYVRPACVEQAFYEGGRTLSLQYSYLQIFKKGYVCSNPRLPAAKEACCEYPPPSTSCDSETCIDDNVCTENLCSNEIGECLNPFLPGCTNGFVLETWNKDFTEYETSKYKWISNFKNDPNYPDIPDKIEVITGTSTSTLEAPVNRQNYFGSRLRTYISPPTTGEYTFWIKGRDVGELRLSLDTDPANVGTIAWFTWPRDLYTKEDAQKSDLITLTHGEFYYLEVLYVGGRWDDHVSVAWNLASKDSERQEIPIVNTRLQFHDGAIAQMLNSYDDERVTYETAQTRCKKHAANLEFEAGMCSSDFVVDAPTYKTGHHWTDEHCVVSIKVTSDDSYPGWIAIVHETAANGSMAQFVDNASLNFFPAIWDGGVYPDPNDSCGGDGSECLLEPDGSCMCATSVLDSALFDGMPSTVDDALENLFIGAIDPSSSTILYETEIDDNTGIVAHKKVTEGGVGAEFDISTIFEIYQEKTQRIFFLKNVVSKVIVGDGRWSFRNAPHFMSMVPSETEVRDAQYEVEAVLDYYFYHDNMAPFLAKLLIQRFNIASNPSPTYVKAVVEAFRTGLYTYEDEMGAMPMEDSHEQYAFGSGEYGDLAATVGAILLHPESRSPTLDLDFASGSVRQPLLKLLALMRNMGTPSGPDLLNTNSLSLHDLMGQGPHDFDSVFSHFLSTFPDAGRGVPAGFLAPEQMVLDTPRIANLVNNMHGMVIGSQSLIKNWNYSWTRNSKMTFGEVVNELATLLTSGRLSRENRVTIKRAWITEGQKSNWANAFNLVKRMIISSAEFHSTSIARKSDADRNAEDDGLVNLENKVPDNYKAVVFLMLAGGLDSYNVLVPHTCEGTEVKIDSKNYTLDEQYTRRRGAIALEMSSLHQISAENQPCSKFGVHPSLESVVAAYEDGDALFVANAGHLSEPVTKTDFQKKTVGGLFGHFSGTNNAGKVDPFNQNRGTGVLGRLRDVLKRKGHKESAINVDSTSFVLMGQKGQSSGPIGFSANGIPAFPASSGISTLKTYMESVNNATTSDSSIMAESWSSALDSALHTTKQYRLGFLSKQTFTAFPGSSLGKKLKAVSRLQQVNLDLDVTRDFYYVKAGSFDLHFDSKPLASKLDEVDAALAAYIAELKALSLWKSTVLVQTSDFGRTLGPNGNTGTDHGWGGNYFLLGGSVQGGKVLGKFPPSFYRGAYKSGRIFIPSTPWDSIWNGVSEWMDLSLDSELNEVLPNRGKFGSETLFDGANMFECAEVEFDCAHSGQCCNGLFCSNEGRCVDKIIS